jgi:hypothetical protein
MACSTGGDLLSFFRILFLDNLTITIPISRINQSSLVNMAPATTTNGVSSVAELSIKDIARPTPLELSAY